MDSVVNRLEIHNLTSATEHTTGFVGTARHLRVLAPPVWSVKIRRCRLAEGSNGDCGLVVHKRGEPYFVIRIEKDLPESTQIFVLLHEWAHALSWGSESHRVRAHGPEWGIAMSRIWQELVED